MNGARGSGKYCLPTLMEIPNAIHVNVAPRFRDQFEAHKTTSRQLRRANSVNTAIYHLGI
jgi:hypothetical protein